jgi:hypothetical protein
VGSFLFPVLLGESLVFSVFVCHFEFDVPVECVDVGEVVVEYLPLALEAGDFHLFGFVVDF